MTVQNTVTIRKCKTRNLCDEFRWNSGRLLCTWVDSPFGLRVFCFRTVSAGGKYRQSIQIGALLAVRVNHGRLSSRTLVKQRRCCRGSLTRSHKDGEIQFPALRQAEPGWRLVDPWHLAYAILSQRQAEKLITPDAWVVRRW